MNCAALVGCVLWLTAIFIFLISAITFSFVLPPNSTVAAIVRARTMTNKAKTLPMMIILRMFYFWYMGHTQCFKANVAYSLYGVLKSDSSAGSSTAATCNKHTYINSFFTTFGPESFTGPLGLGVDTINSYCSTDQEKENMYANADDVYELRNGMRRGRLVRDR